MTRATLLRFCRFVLGPLSLALGFSLVTGTMLISGQIIAPPALGAFQKDSIECIEFHTWPSLPEELDDEGEYLDANVASVKAEVMDGAAADDDKLVVRVQGAYPSYGVKCFIPYNVSAENGNLVELQGGVAFSWGKGLTDCKPVEVEGPAQRWACRELTVLYDPPLSDSCIQPGTYTDELIFHVEQPALQKATMNFDLTLMWFECDPGTPTPDPVEEETPTGNNSGSSVTGQFTSEISPAQQVAPRAVARVSPAASGDGGLVGLGGDVSRVGLGATLVIAGLCLLAARLPLGLVRHLRLGVSRGAAAGGSRGASDAWPAAGLNEDLYGTDGSDEGKD